MLMLDSYISITDKNKKIFKDGTTYDGTAKERGGGTKRNH